jgi:hypothetical protein
MALVDTTWYTNFGNGTSTGYYAVTVRPQNTAVAAGVLRRQFTAPAVGSERVFVCIVAGTTANVTDATWVLTRGAKTTDGTATWMECSGQAGLNGDLTNTATWVQVKAATPAVLGQIIKRSNNASYQICTTAGAMSATEPTFSDTAGVTTTDTTAVWTSLGPVANFTGGQAPHARFISALASNWFASGNTVYIGDNHTETGATSPTATSALMARILCHNHSGSYPPTAGDIMAGASISGSATFTISLIGSFYVYGIKFIETGAPSNFAIAAVSINQENWSYFDNCAVEVGAGSSGFSLGATSTAWGIIVFNNTTVKFASTGSYIRIQCVQLLWQNTGQILAAGSSIPAVLFQPSTSLMFNNITLEALDLSQLTGSLVPTLNNMLGPIVVKDCKLNAALSATTPTNAGLIVQLIRSASDATAYKSSRIAYEGTETTETSITRVGGATDPAGQVQARKIVTTANAQWLRPYKAEPYAVWNAITGANITVTVYGTGASLPNNDDIWLEVEYLGSSTTPLGTIVTTTKANLLTAGSAVASDSSTWSGGGGSPFKLTKTLSSPQPAMAGYIHARVRAAKASATYYIDPQIYLS